jgi:hypothetical protein
VSRDDKMTYNRIRGEKIEYLDDMKDAYLVMTQNVYPTQKKDSASAKMRILWYTSRVLILLRTESR